MNIIKKILCFFVLTLIIQSCAYFKKKEEVATNQETVKVKKKTRTVNMKDRILESDSGGIFNSARQSMRGTTYEFATSNVMWRASLETLDFIPLTSVNYSGGLIVTDWYSSSNSKESIKIEVRFLDSEVKASSFKVSSFKKICNTENNCHTIKGKSNFNKKIKDKILAKIRDLRVLDEQKKLKN